MRAIHLLGSFLLLSIAGAQITIGQGDMPSEGDTLHFSTAQQPDIDVATTGGNITWNYSTLVPIDQGSNIAVSVGVTPFLYQFYFNNPILYPDHDASFAMEGADFSFQTFTVEEVYDYFKKDATGYRNVGFGAMVNGLPSSVRKTPVDRIYEFPMEYGDTDSSFSSWEIEIPGTFFLRQEQWRHNEVDGWGTLILPTDTFQVLRVRSELNRHDSIYIDQFGTGFGIDEPIAIEHKWIAPGMGRPVLQITTVAGVPTAIEFHHDAQVPTSIANIGREQLLLHPNPASDRVNWNLPVGSSGDLIIRDLNGRIIRNSRIMPGTDRNFSVSEIPNGIYSIEFIEGPRIRHGRLVIAR